MIKIRTEITKENIRAEQVLIDNGIDKDEAECVLQAIGYTLLDTELYGNDVANEIHNNSL